MQTSLTLFQMILEIFYFFLPILLFLGLLFGTRLIEHPTLRRFAGAWTIICQVLVFVTGIGKEPVSDSLLNAVFVDVQTMAFITFLGFVLLILVSIRLYQIRDEEPVSATSPAEAAPAPSSTGHLVDRTV